MPWNEITSNWIRRPERLSMTKHLGILLSPRGTNTSLLENLDILCSDVLASRGDETGNKMLKTGVLIRRHYADDSVAETRLGR